jgi:hypothetical protein
MEDVLGRTALFPRKHLFFWDGITITPGRTAYNLGRTTHFHYKVLGKTSEMPFFSSDSPLWVLFGSSEPPLWVLGKTSGPEVAKRFN